LKSIIDCFDADESCDGDVCELGKICLYTLNGDGNCYPKECEDYFLAVRGPKAVKNRSHAAPKTQKKFSAEMCYENGEVQCRSDRECGREDVCMANGEGSSYCYPQECLKMWG